MKVRDGQHVFVTVLARRWCLRCDLFQQRRGAARGGWHPVNNERCPMLYDVEARIQGIAEPAKQALIASVADSGKVRIGAMSPRR
jgi:hypothetical protein